jgi:hypothetical protein
MAWKKLGCIFEPNTNLPWVKSHAMLPTALLLGDVIRVFYCARGHDGKSRTSYFDVNAADPTKLVYTHDKPALEPETLGTFDDSGALPGSVLKVGKTIFLYYVGYNLRVTVPYSNAIGVAVSEDDGKNFLRPFLGPIVDRNAAEPYFAISPCVMHENGLWRMWYGSGTGWIDVNGKPESLYHIKYAESKDGMTWQRDNLSCILPRDEKEANVRPTVVKDGKLYRMWYSFRGSLDFRDGADSYRIGYAESTDGKKWNRLDDKSGIEKSGTGWDSTMLAYPNALNVNGTLYLFYNGNDFGQTGIGLAQWESKN